MYTYVYHHSGWICFTPYDWVMYVCRYMPIGQGYYKKHWLCQPIGAYFKDFVNILRHCSEQDRLPCVCFQLRLSYVHYLMLQGRTKTKKPPYLTNGHHLQLAPVELSRAPLSLGPPLAMYQATYLHMYSSYSLVEMFWTPTCVDHQAFKLPRCLISIVACASIGYVPSGVAVALIV